MGYNLNNQTDSSIDKKELSLLLDNAVARYNTPDFVANDPVQFPRSFSTLSDIEIVALLASTIAWGNRKMILNDCKKLLAMMENQPSRFLLDQAYEGLPDANIHRTFFTENLKHYLRGLYRIYSKHGSLEAFAANKEIQTSPTPAWDLAAAINAEIAAANDGKCDSRCLPQNLDTTALKRLNMALRWLVRKDGIVDIGCWDLLSPSQLFIPMDVHVARGAQTLNLIQRKAVDKKAVIELTDVFKKLRPDDPVIYDFALFGLGESGELANLKS